jgi:ubiquinol-cytochrome c reductase cytochrome c subunit
MNERRRLGRRAVLGMAAAVVGVSVPLGLLLTPASGRPLAVASPVVSTSSPSPASALVLADGKTTYEERCSTCHGPTAAGTDQGPPIAGLGPAYWDFMMSTGRMPLDQPGGQAKRRPPVLTPGQIRAVTAYLETIPPGDGVPVPRVDTGEGSLSLGESTFQGNCAPCHGTTGHGGAVGPQDAPPVTQATSTQVAEAIRIGPGTMPVFDESTIDQHTLNSLVAYVDYLRRPDDRGGSGLGGVGPLIEGFVALVGGLGLIVLVTRTIGTRS